MCGGEVTVVLELDNIIQRCGIAHYSWETKWNSMNIKQSKVGLQGNKALKGL